MIASRYTYDDKRLQKLDLGFRQHTRCIHAPGNEPNADTLQEQALILNRDR